MCIGGLELQRKALKADFMTEQSTRIPFHSASPKVGIILLWYPLFTQPFIFRGELYASAAIIGLISMAFLDSAIIAFCIIFALRALAIRYHISLKRDIAS